MKRISYIAIISVIIGLVVVLWPDERHIAVEMGEDISYAREFGADLAKNLNKKGISVYVQEEKITFLKEKAYISDKGCLMFPVNMLTDTFNCSTQIYENGNVRIEKGSNSISLYANSAAVNINGQIVELSDKVQNVKEELYIPIEDIAHYINYNVEIDYKTAEISMRQIAEEIVLPESYDMRELGRVTPVRDQGRFGTCWAFASLAAVETTISPKDKMVFSVDHMNYFAGNGTNGDIGGDSNMAIAYLASWQGPVLESDDPYGDMESNPDATTRKHLEEALMIGEKDYQGIKEAIYKYGGVETSIYIQPENMVNASPYYNWNHSAYYYNQERKCNHAVVIVGWDDHYSRENFSVKPNKDGAFICRNSWGTYFGDGGYFYVSYEDANIGISNIVYSKVGNVDNYDNIYQSDLRGWTGQLGYEKENSAYFANVYQTESKENLEAVAFYAVAPQTNYQVYIVRDYQDEDSLSKRTLVAKGSLNYAGYYTIPLEQIIRLEEKERFAVVVHVNTPGVCKPIAIEYQEENSTEEIIIEDGEGYISLYGRKWSRVEEQQGCNLCLKAFTSDR